MPALKPIETVYRGYRFRSRLEARWAVFFDTLELPWKYEDEGYELGPAGWYLPDFSFEQVFTEIKPKGYPSDRTQLLCEQLATCSDKGVQLVCGDPWPDEYEGFYFAPNAGLVYIDAAFYCCPGCGAVGMSGLNSQLCWTCGGQYQFGFASKSLMRAYAAARGARFEHGETPGR